MAFLPVFAMTGLGFLLTCKKSACVTLVSQLWLETVTQVKGMLLESETMNRVTETQSGVETANHLESAVKKSDTTAYDIAMAEVDRYCQTHSPADQQKYSESRRGTAYCYSRTGAKADPMAMVRGLES